MIMVGLVSVVTIPLQLKFASFSALENYAGYDMNQYTLGNMGGADAYCD